MIITSKPWNGSQPSLYTKCFIVFSMHKFHAANKPTDNTLVYSGRHPELTSRIDS